MKISYRYKKSGKMLEGEIATEIDENDHHAVFSSALQTIADKEDVVIAVGMMSSASPDTQIGRNHFIPASGNEDVHHEIESIEITTDGKEWKTAALISPAK
jgi:hypothetical protein